MTARKAPRSIHVASISLLLAASVQAGVAFLVSSTNGVGFAQWIFAVVVMGVLVWGIARGYRLAWLWGRWLTLFLAATVLAGLGLGFWKGELPWRLAAVMLAGLVLPLVTTSIALGRRSAFEWFALRCPGCGKVTGRGNDFLFREARCGKCGDVF
ncbi:MAG: hypothetical protein WCK73_09705 [Deltaproteobacteria bacterium]